MRKVTTIALTCLLACGDNDLGPDARPPIDAGPDSVVHGGPLTWGDAEQVWADAWCAYAERCYPTQFAEAYHTYAECRIRVREQNCAWRDAVSEAPCSSPYPESGRMYLELCFDDMMEIACTATVAPTTCYAAFGVTARVLPSDGRWIGPIGLRAN